MKRSPHFEANGLYTLLHERCSIRQDGPPYAAVLNLVSVFSFFLITNQTFFTRTVTIVFLSNEAGS
jgi:hypothetical protein